MTTIDVTPEYMLNRMNSSFINRSSVWPHKHTVVKSVQTVLSQIYLNKLLIADVLIDIIKDYLYYSEKEIIQKFNRFCINSSIERLSVNHYYFVDFFERRRQVHWSIGHVHGGPEEVEIQLQQTMCVACGESCTRHMNFDGCCTMAMDGEDGMMELEIETGQPVDEDETYNIAVDPFVEPVDELFDDDHEMYDSDDYYAGDRYGAHSKGDDRDDDY
jgi:hypothetical protein